MNEEEKKGKKKDLFRISVGFGAFPSFFILLG